MSLLEVIAVVTIVGLLGAMAFMRFGHDTISNIGAQSLARQIALDCMQARSRAISDGRDHYLLFTLSGPNATQYALYRSQTGTDPRVDDIHVVPTGVTVTPSSSQPTFEFTGEASASYTITVSGPDRSWLITIAQLSGTATVTET
jgi:type II secretory pathway pseudopilin PulG